MNYFGCFYQDQCIETNTKRILSSTCALYPAETVALNKYSIELKSCS